MASDSTSPIAGDTTPYPRRRSPDMAPRYRTLDGVVAGVSRADGIGLIDVDAFTTLVVRTDNSVYRITILTPHLREVVVQGGKFFPERTRACLSGSNFGGSCLKIGWVGLSLHMEFGSGSSRRTCGRSRSRRPRPEHPASGSRQEAHVRDVRPLDPPATPETVRHARPAHNAHVRVLVAVPCASPLEPVPASA